MLKVEREKDKEKIEAKTIDKNRKKSLFRPEGFNTNTIKKFSTLTNWKLIYSHGFCSQDIDQWKKVDF